MSWGVNRFYCLAVLLLAVGCGEGVDVAAGGAELPLAGSAIRLSVTANAAAQSRISVDDGWALSWEADDKLIGWGYNSRGGSSVYEKFSISDFDPQASTFEGEFSCDSEVDHIRLVYPYERNAIGTNSNLYSVDLGSQQCGLSMLRMVSSDLVSIADVSSVDMAHIGAVAIISTTFLSPSEDYTLEGVCVEGLCSSAVVDLTQPCDAASLYLSSSVGAIEVELLEPIVACDPTEVCFCIMPSTIAAGGTIEVTYTLRGVQGDLVAYTDTICNTLDMDIIFGRGTYNTINSVCDLSSIGTFAAPYSCVVTPAANNAELIFAIDLDLCDGVVVGDCSTQSRYDASNSWLLEHIASGELSYYTVVSDSSPVWACAYGDQLAAATDYVVEVVAYKYDAVSDSYSVVGDLDTISFTTLSL